MKILTSNFVTCAVKACKSSSASYPLHFQNAELEEEELEFQPDFVRNILPRIDWEALKISASEVSRPALCSRPDPNKYDSYGFVLTGYFLGLARVPVDK